MLNLCAAMTMIPLKAAGHQERPGTVEIMQRPTIRTRDMADVSLREMVAHLNVIEASIDVVGKGAGVIDAKARDVLGRLEQLAFCAARLHIAEVPRLTDALEELVLAMQMGRPRPEPEVTATLRHGVDVLLLLTHDKMRRLQGHAAADLRPATEAVLQRVDRLIAEDAPPAATPLRLAGI
jgi:hypothetical protein